MEGSNSEPIGTKVWWRHWSVVFILAVLAAFVVWALIKAGPWLRGWQERSAADTLRKQAEEQLRNDKYGGKTPEETFDMLIAALEKGDVELASKYFVVQKQGEWLKTLKNYENANLLPDFIVELKEEKTNWVPVKTVEKNIAQYNYPTIVEQDTTANFRGQKLEIPRGKYTNSIIFEKYLSGVWKINGL